MRDPYLYNDVDVLKNKGDIKDANLLKTAEGDITKYTLSAVYAHKFTKFNTATICEIHRIILTAFMNGPANFAQFMYPSEKMYWVGIPFDTLFQRKSRKNWMQPLRKSQSSKNPKPKKI